MIIIIIVATIIIIIVVITIIILTFLFCFLPMTIKEMALQVATRMGATMMKTRTTTARKPPENELKNQFLNLGIDHRARFCRPG